MFVKPITKPDRHGQNKYTYYRLCESYRIGKDTRQRTIISLGELSERCTDQERKLLADRIEDLIKSSQSLFGSDVPDVIGDEHVSDSSFIEKIFETLVSTEKLEYRRKLTERLLGKQEKIKATFINKIIYSDLYKIAKKPFVAAPYFCEACGLHFGLNLEKSIAVIKYIKYLRLIEMEASGFYFDIDLSKFDDENYQSEDDFRNNYFHAGFCGYCDSDKKWIEMRPILDGLH